MAIRTLRSMVDELVELNAKILDAYVRDKLDEHDMLEAANGVYEIRSHVERSIAVAQTIVKKVT